MDSTTRTLTKALIWNMIGLFSMCVVGYFATGSIATGGLMAVVNTLLGFSLYVIYERVWARVSWGRKTWLPHV